MPLLFEGTAHPAAAVGMRAADADLSAGEIAAMNMGNATAHRESTPINVEHEGPSVGRVLASTRARNGSLLVSGTITDEDAARKVRSGEMLGLSLGTAVRSLNGKCVGRSIDHLAVCEVPRRAGCYIHEINGRRAPMRMDHASGRSSAGARHFFATPSPLSPSPSHQHPARAHFANAQ